MLTLDLSLERKCMSLCLSMSSDWILHNSENSFWMVGNRLDNSSEIDKKENWKFHSKTRRELVYKWTIFCENYFRSNSVSIQFHIYSFYCLLPFAISLAALCAWIIIYIDNFDIYLRIVVYSDNNRYSYKCEYDLGRRVYCCFSVFLLLYKIEWFFFFRYSRFGHRSGVYL